MSLPNSPDPAVREAVVRQDLGNVLHPIHGRASAGGYEGPIEIPRASALLTPPSTLGALRGGYRPVLHLRIDAMQAATADA